ncbi:hypothetical protein PM396_gp32 [Xanthomonas phage vB_Xar_IVIA-DoCa1]|uniref:Uncharacterized protein n=1 Tax=Xanthomonas phage vB_Xar_IVIA-DoCa1 TaxID=2970490 RepID=A0A976SGT8_9CAUD|nr:hypothetical protein PM396_gp32 [Xanthomonas phage vB_Xar_IVIA-DoCa1]UVB02955.1 hypothetical protein IVIADoCa1_32 [Xanthomonas phage vB_Xar_IVIA-DoCa1]
MSGGTACKCEESKKPITERKWFVYQRNCNHSAFNGYRRTYSEWSSIGCQCCRATWRTKADYVFQLKDYSPH